MKTSYETRKAQIWMIQVRNKGTDEAWCPTGARYFHTKADAQREIADIPWTYLEYRATKYLPEGW